MNKFKYFRLSNDQLDLNNSFPLFSSKISDKQFWKFFNFSIISPVTIFCIWTSITLIWLIGKRIICKSVSYITCELISWFKFRCWLFEKSYRRFFYFICRLFESNFYTYCVTQNRFMISHLFFKNWNDYFTYAF